MSKCYFNQTGELQVQLDELNRKIVFLCENGGFNEKNDWLIGAKNQKLDRMRKVQRAYVALYESGEASRLLGVSAKEIASGGLTPKWPSAEAALEVAIREAMVEQGIG